MDRVCRPGLFENLHDFARALIPIAALCGFAGEVGTDNVHRQAPFKHMIERGQSPRQHDRLHLSAPHRSEHIARLRQWRAPGDKAQRILSDLIGRGAENVAKTLPLGFQQNVSAVRPAGL